MTHPNIPLTETQHQVLTGLMLGDGHLNISAAAINAKLMVSRAIKDKDYIQYESLIFANLLAPRYKNGVHYYSSFDKRNGSLREGYSFATINNSSLTEIHNKWYVWTDGHYMKIVPSDLVLSSIVIAHWVADDGSVSYNKLPYRLVLELSTHGFTEIEVRFLAKLLSERYNEEFLVRPKNRKGKTYFIIKAYDSAFRAVIKDIDLYFKMDRKRIWDNLESRYYDNQPERQINMVKQKMERDAHIVSLIAAGNDFSLKKITADFKTDNKTINKFLKPYIDDGLIYKDMDRFDNNTIIIRICR